MGRRALIAGACLALAGCRGKTTSHVVDAAAVERVTQKSDAPPVVAPPTRNIATRIVCPVGVDIDLDGLQERTALAFKHGEFVVALACAEQGVRAFPRNVQAHSDRAIALALLRRHREAERAFTLALALDPDDPETLGAAADFYINHLEPEHGAAQIALEYARRALAILVKDGDPATLSTVAVAEARALDALGRPEKALASVEMALRANPNSVEAKMERATIWFQLCQFARAREAFELLAQSGNATAHHYLGLLLERDGQPAAAERRFARARAIAPQIFFDPTSVSKVAFQKMLDDVIESLDRDTQKLLGRVTVGVQDLPELDDLLEVQPPLPPTILGLYRGSALGEPSIGDEPEARQIVLYRLNLQRISRSRVMLIEQIRITLRHELGHLLGEGDDQLHHRGLD